MRVLLYWGSDNRFVKAEKHAEKHSMEMILKKVAELIDEVIMEKIKEGNLPLLAILFERYHLKLYNYFLRLTTNTGTSEDLTQEVFFRILKYHNTFRNESKFSTWMYQIARNAHIDHIRKHKPETPLHESWDEAHAPEPQPHQQSETEQESSLIHQALNLLPPAKKEILMLSRFQEMKYNDISKVLGCSLASVKVQIHRAIKELRNNYTKLNTKKIEEVAYD